MDAPSAWLDADDQKIWTALLTVVIALPTLLDRQLQRDASMSNFEYSVLARLSMAEDGTMRLGELARDCNSPLPRLSKVIDRFEARGWVVRCVDPRNGRYTLASLTDDGLKKVVDSAPGHVAEVRRLVFDPLSAAQRRHLGAGLARIAASLQQDLWGR